jgi:Uncharacterized conserved protein
MSVRFDIGALRERAGDKVFARGQAYHRDGQVEILSMDQARVLARVAGNEIYRTELQGKGRSFSGMCSCPAFSDWGFCKHLVATALAANQGQAPKDNPFDRIRRHLREQGIDALVEFIVGMAERDHALFQSLDLAAGCHSASDDDLFARFRKAITDATRTRGYVEYGEAADWAAGVEAVLDLIDALAADRPAVVLRLMDYAFARLDKTLNEIDDSDGHGGVLADRARAIHLRACRAARPDPVALARELFAREIDSDWDFFSGAVRDYADVLGEAGLAEYRKLATAAWEKIKPVGGERKVHDEESGRRAALAAILDALAEMDDDTEARIAIRARDLSSPHRYRDLAEFCLAHDRAAEALRWAEEGLWQFEDVPDDRLVLFTADLYRQLGRAGDAETLLWKQFECRPGLELYRHLKAAGTTATVRDRAIAVLRAQVAKGGRRGGWSSPADLLVRLLMDEKMYDAAWEAVAAHGANDGLLRVLAEASEQTHPRQALAVHIRRVDDLVGAGGNGNYEEAVRLIARIGELRQRLGEDAEHPVYVAGLRTRYKARRNFMKLLPG